ncbi:MAG: tetratricopeptide repeat protein [bacterium]
MEQYNSYKKVKNNKFTNLIILSIFIIISVVIFIIYFLINNKEFGFSSNISSYANSAQENLNKGKYSEAAADFDKIIAIAPKDSKILAYAYSAKADAEFLDNNMSSAESDYNQALLINPELKDAYYSLAKIYRAKNQKKAISFLEKAISLDPKNIQKPSNEYILDTENLIYGGMGDNQKVIEISTKMLSFNPNNGDAYFERGTAYSNLHQFKLALDDLNKAMSISSAWNTYLVRGSVEKSLSMKTQACDDFKQIKTPPIDPGYVLGYKDLSDYCK